MSETANTARAVGAVNPKFLRYDSTLADRRAIAFNFTIHPFVLIFNIQISSKPVLIGVWPLVTLYFALQSERRPTPYPTRRLAYHVPFSPWR